MARVGRAAVTCGLVVGALGLAARAALAQTRPAFFDEPSTVERVGDVPRGAKVPLLVLLPPTGSVARASLPPDARDAAGLGPHFEMSTPGSPASSDYLPQFSRYLGWASERVVADVDRALREHPIDPERVYLVGFSVGGDVAWGVLARNPERFRGALVIGSRASAGLRGNATEQLRARGARVAFAIGKADQETRRAGARRAHERLRAASIATELLEYEGGHQVPDAETYRRALAFLLAPAAP